MFLIAVVLIELTQLPKIRSWNEYEPTMKWHMVCHRHASSTLLEGTQRATRKLWLLHWPVGADLPSLQCWRCEDACNLQMDDVPQAFNRKEFSQSVLEKGMVCVPFLDTRRSSRLSANSPTVDAVQLWPSPKMLYQHKVHRSLIFSVQHVPYSET